MSTAKKVIIAIIVIIVIAGISFGAIWIGTNWDKIISQTDLYTYQDMIDYSEEKNQELQDELENYKLLYEEAIKKMSEAEDDKNELTTQIANLQKEIEDKLEIIANKDGDISELTEEITGLQTSIENLNNQILEKNNQITYYQELLEAYEGIDKLIVTFVLVDNGKQITYDVQAVDENDYLAEVITPSGDFEGWALTIGGEYIENLTTVQVTENMTIYGIFSNTVTYVVQGETSTEVIEYNGKITKTIEVNGYDFLGWSLSDGGEVISTDYTVTKDVTVYAILEKIYYSLQNYEEGKQAGETDFYIYEPEDLVAFENLSSSGEQFINDTIYLANNIDMEGITYQVDSSNAEFCGIIDGQNYTISNFTSTNGLVYRTGYQYYSVETSYINYGAEIKNIKFENINIQSSNDNVGGIVNSQNYGSLIFTNCHILSGTISGESGTGGMLGYGSATIEKCSNNANISGSRDIGGLVGLASNVTIKNSYNTGNIITSSSTSNVGGLIGSINVIGEITNSYNSGDINGYTNAGGFVGRNSANNSLKIYNCFNLGNVSIENKPYSSSEGALVGTNTTSSTLEIYNCKYINSNLNVIGTGTTTQIENTEYVSTLESDVKTKEFFSVENWNNTYPWDFENTWTIDSNVNNGLPYLI